MTQPSQAPPPSLNPNDLNPVGNSTGLITGTQPPPPVAPSDLSTATGRLGEVRQAKLQAEYEWNEFLRNNPGVKGDESSGWAYRQSPGQKSWDMNGLSQGTNSQFDPDATKIYQKYWLLSQEEQALEGAMKDKLWGTDSAGMSYVESEELKASEAKREFTDAMTRIKALYDLREQESDMMQENQKLNVQTEKDVIAGRTSWADSMVRPMYIPAGARQSDKIAETIPERVPPFYSLSESLGMEGTQGLGGGISGYSEGTGFATLPSSNSRKSAGGSVAGVGGLDPELAWLVGRPDVPVILDPNTVPKLPPTNSNRKAAPARPQPPANPGFQRLP